MADDRLQEELEYFKQNQTELIRKYEGRFLVIKDKIVRGVYDREIEAYNDGKAKFELGTFLIQQALPGEKSYTQTLHSRAVPV